MYASLDIHDVHSISVGEIETLPRSTTGTFSMRRIRVFTKSGDFTTITLFAAEDNPENLLTLTERAALVTTQPTPEAA